MALTKEQLIAKIDAAIADIAQHVGAADWASQDAAINGVMDASSAVFLRLNLQTGEFVGPQQMVMPNLASFEFAMRALVDFWAALLDDLASKAEIQPQSEQQDLAYMFARLAKYRSALDAAKGTTGPSEIVWLRVGLPMLVGIYPPDFAEAGIINPEVRSPPDIFRPFTLSWQWTIAAQHKQEAWKQLSADLKNGLVDVVTAIINTPAKVIEGVKGVVDGFKSAAKEVGRTGKTLAIGIGLSLIGLAAYSLIRK